MTTKPTDDTILEWIRGRMTAYANRAGLEERWRRWERLAHSVATERYYQGSSRLFVPETRRAIKSWMSFVDEVLFGPPEYFRIVPVWTERDKTGAVILQRLIAMQNRKNRFRYWIRRGLWDKAVKGMAIYKYGWSSASLRTVADDENDVTDNVFFETRSLWNMYFDPYIEEWGNQECIIERTYMTTAQLRRFRSVCHVDIDQVLKEMDEYAVREKEERRETFADVVTGISADVRLGRDKHEVWEVWATYDDDGDGKVEECLYWVLNGKKLIRRQRNPYLDQRKPYLLDVFERVEGTCVGYGIPHLTEKDQIGLNDAMNQVMDNITMILNNMWIVDKGANIPAWQLKSRPNGVIESDMGVEAVLPVAKQLTANEGLKAIAMFKENIRVATGLTQPMTGAQARYDTTAYEYSQLTAAGSRDVMSAIRDTEECVIEPYLRAAYKLNLQYLDKKTFLRIFGVEGTKYLEGISSVSDLIRGDYDFEPVGVTRMESKVSQMQQMLTFLNILSGIPGADVGKVANIIWRQFMGRTEDVIPESQPPTLIDPKDENVILDSGGSVDAKPIEPHERHIEVHRQGRMNPAREAHILQHEMLKQVVAQAQPSMPMHQLPVNGPRETLTPDFVATRQIGTVVPGGADEGLY